jgi:hypothetical protein
MRVSGNVYCGLLGSKLIGPFFFDDELTSNAYKYFLKNGLPGLLEGIPLIVRGQSTPSMMGLPQITLSL